MQLGCTEKLLKYLKKPAVPADPAAVPFFSWSASLLTVNYQQVLVAANDACYCGFVLYGLTDENVQHLEEDIFSGIRAVLEAECIAPDLVQRYMEDCGTEISWTKTANRAVVARLNRVGGNARAYGHCYTEKCFLQRHILRCLNFSMFFCGGNEYTVSHLMGMKFCEHYGVKQAFQYEMLDLNVVLQLETPCSRVIRMNSGYTLRDLHRVLQAIFFWQEEHLHEFRSPDDAHLENLFPEYESLMDGSDGYPDYDLAEDSISLKEAFDRCPVLHYVYDLGDGWRHVITPVGRTVSSTMLFPECLSAEGTPPPEDAGGIDGYANFLRIMEDPRDKEYEDSRDWAESQGWKPLCSLGEIQKRLRNEHWLVFW